MKRNGRWLIALMLLAGIVVVAVLASWLFYRSSRAQLPWRPLVPTNWQDDSHAFALLNEQPEASLDEPPEELAAWQLLLFI